MIPKKDEGGVKEDEKTKVLGARDNATNDAKGQAKVNAASGSNPIDGSRQIPAGDVEDRVTHSPEEGREHQRQADAERAREEQRKADDAEFED